MAGREAILEAGDAVIGQADEHPPVVRDEPPQLRERRQRVVHVLEHVDHRDQRETLGRRPLADLRIGAGLEIGHQHRHAERPRVVGHDLDVVHAERFAAELAQAMREIRIRWSRRRACAPARRAAPSRTGVARAARLTVWSCADIRCPADRPAADFSCAASYTFGGSGDWNHASQFGHVQYGVPPKR